jgi:hypothetical protein
VPVTYGPSKTKLDYLKAAAKGTIYAVVAAAYLFMHVCMYSCMHVFMYACIHVCMYAVDAAAYLFTAISYGPMLRGKVINN